MDKVRSQPSKLDIIDTFTLASIASIVIIRGFLLLTGFPQIGGDAYHIAHVLWGGLLLTVTLLASLLSHTNRLVIALLGGVGFGFFIDEVGKFVTTDNNYFYDGSFFLMYVSVLLIWLIARVAVVRNTSELFFLPAQWPSKRWEGMLLITWAGAQMISTVIALVAVRRADSGLNAIDWIYATASIFHLTVLVVGVWLFTRKKLHGSASVLRMAAFIEILAILPFVYYEQPILAASKSIFALMVMVGLSEVSFKQLASKLWPF
jgi:hypothetical protein